MKKILFVIGIALLALIPITANASPQGKLNQTINAGALSTDIVDGAGAAVALPSFNMAATTIKNTCQTITGTYGDTAQRVTVDNPGGANGGWVLSIAATSGPTAKWVSGANNYAFNDATGAGCTNGQLTLNPAASTLNLNGTSTNTAITKGASTAFVSGTADSITLLTAAAGSDDIWSGYLTGIGVSQKIPASKPAGTYTIDLTQTVVAS